MTSPATGYWPGLDTRHKFPAVKWVLNTTKKWLVTPITVMPLLYQWVHLAWQLDNVALLLILFPRSLPSTSLGIMKAFQQGTWTKLVAQHLSKSIWQHGVRKKIFCWYPKWDVDSLARKARDVYGPLLIICEVVVWIIQNNIYSGLWEVSWCLLWQQTNFPAKPFIFIKISY